MKSVQYLFGVFLALLLLAPQTTKQLKDDGTLGVVIVGKSPSEGFMDWISEGKERGRLLTAVNQPGAPLSDKIQQLSHFQQNVKQVQKKQDQREVSSKPLEIEKIH